MIRYKMSLNLLKIVLAGLLSALLIYPALSQNMVDEADLKFWEYGFPVEINLSDQFHAKTQMQEGGTCHIYSATALYEAACFRATGKRVNISEAYFYYLHLKGELENRDSVVLSGFDNITAFDGGDPANTLNQILMGRVCTEDTMPTDSRFFRMLIDVLNGNRTKLWRMNHRVEEGRILSWMSEFEKTLFKQRCQTHYETKSKQDLLSRMDEFVAGFCPDLVNLDHNRRENLVERSQSERDLEDCLKLPIRRVSLGDYGTIWSFLTRKTFLKTAIKLLTNGVPFMCLGSKNSEGITRGDITHTTMVVGYRRNDALSEKIEFLVRDSNQEKPSWGWRLSCSEIMLLLTEGENGP